MRSNAIVSDEAQTEKRLYQARLAELDNEFSLGSIDEASLTSAKAEEARKLLKLSNSSSIVNPSLFSSKFSMLATALFIPIFSLVIYMSVGTPEVIFQQAVIEEASQSNLEELMAVAEKRLLEHPDDLRGWMVVAPVYARQGNFAKSINAYKNAIRLSNEDPELTFALGEVFVTQSQGRVSEEAVTYFQKTIELNKEHASARFMLGLAAFQSGENDKAISIWQALIDSAQGNEEWVSVVQQRIDTLRGIETDTKAPQVSQDAINNAAQLSDSERLEMINQMVSDQAEKLAEDPSDKQGWARLIRSYMVLGKYEDAETAITKAAELFSDDADFVKFASDVRTQIKNVGVESNQ